ncbi:MAG: glutamate--tRNA ligase [Candidatus Margulisiibacteriota bacterium]
MVRVRFAPSPTGNLHIGSARTALFNWLFARHHHGACILRIEDTDVARSTPEFEANIFEGLRWLGLTFDESPEVGGPHGPYRQSERMTASTYHTYVDTLIGKHDAYKCFCTAEELDQERQVSIRQGTPYKYSRKCLDLSQSEIAALESAGKPYVIRFKVPNDEALIIEDLVRDKIHFDLNLISDFILIKSDRSPSYHFAVVVDDILMQVTHIIRGEDHISNTPGHILLFRALGATIPEIAHIPMILGPDRAKLSKRHGAKSVTQYRDEGYLPEALINYLALLGWSSPDEKEILSAPELAERFTLDRVSKSGAIFDHEKLRWMNGQYIRALAPADFAERVRPYVTPIYEKRLNLFSRLDQARILQMIQDNLTVLSDVNSELAVYTLEPLEIDTLLDAMRFEPADKVLLSHCRTAVSKIDLFTPESIKPALKAMVTAAGIPTGKVFKPVRLAISGSPAGPALAELMSLIGKTEVLRRLDHVLSKR